jgi:PKD domain
MPFISIRQVARPLQANRVSGMAQKVGLKWPPPPTISVRNLVGLVRGSQPNWNTLTDEFDLVVEVSGPAVNRLFQAMHAAGIVRHLYVRGYQRKHVELLINCPRIFMVPVGPPDDMARALLTSRILYHSRALNDPKDPGLSVVADVMKLRVKLFLTTGDPAPLNAGTYLVADWSETSADPNVVDEVKGAILDFISSEGGGSYPIPALGTTSQPIGSAAFQFIQAGGGDLVAVGMNVGSAVKGSKLGLQTNFVQQDWALAISSNFAISQLLTSLQTQLGTLPPPYGPNPLLLSDTSVCIVPNPFGGCLTSVREKVYLESLAITLQNGQIAISGTLRQVSDSILVPPITADFQASATLSIGPAESLKVTVSQPSVQLSEWYAQLLNGVLGGAFTTAIANGIKAAVQSSSGTSFSGLISADVLKSFTSLGGTAAIDITLSANSVSIRPEAIITQGSLAVGGVTVPPVADIVALRGASALTLNLNALGSWSPAQPSTSFLWDFGDGTPQLQSNDSQPAVAVSHTWPQARQYTVKLTVSNQSGLASATQLVVKPGVLELIPPSHPPGTPGPRYICSQAGDFTVTFTVFASGYPASDGSVSLRTSTTPDKVVSANTNALGQATFTVNQAMFTAPAPSGSKPHVIAGMLVNAFCTDYVWAWNYLWLYDCAAASWPSSLMNRVANEVPALSLIARQPVSATPVLAHDVALSQMLLANLAELTVHGSNVFPLEMLLGSPVDQQAYRTRLEELAERMAENLQAIRAAAAAQPPLPEERNTHLIQTAATVHAAESEKNTMLAALAAQLRGDMDRQALPLTFTVRPTNREPRS